MRKKRREVKINTEGIYINKAYIEFMEQNKDYYLELPSDPKDTITLFHGTSTYYLNEILEQGLLPRIQTGNSNWKEEKCESLSYATYLTNKWHYMYAFQTFMKLATQGVTNGNFPCYLEYKVPKSKLMLDEDFFSSKYMKNRINKMKKKYKYAHEIFLNIDWNECLSQYATVAYLGCIPSDYLVSFTVLGNLNLLKEKFISEDSQYFKEFMNWGQGKGKGKLTLQDLFILEDNEYNLVWWAKDIPKNSYIDSIFRRDNGKIACLFKERTIEE